MPDIAVIIPAGGSGTRMGGRTPKQFLRIGGSAILVRSVKAFDRIPDVKQIIVAVPVKYRKRTERILRDAGCRKVTAVVTGGRERQDSVRRALAGVAGAPTLILIHDAVRPLVSRTVILAVIDAAQRWGAAVAGIRVRDTVKCEGKRGFFTSTLPRRLLWAVQTPQGFRRELIERAHRAAHRAGYLGTDDASLVERLGTPVRIVEGSSRNIKITTRDDLAVAGLWAK